MEDLIQDRLGPFLVTAVGGTIRAFVVGGEVAAGYEAIVHKPRRI